MSFVPVLVGPCPAVVLDGAAAVDLVFDLATSTTCCPTQIRCHPCRFLLGRDQLVVLDGAAAVDLVFDWPARRPVADADSMSSVLFLLGRDQTS